MSYRVGGALALVAAALLAISLATGAWWSGHPRVEGHEHAMQDIAIGLVGGEGCNTGGEGGCKRILLGGGFKTIASVELGVGGVTGLLALALAAAVLLAHPARKRLAQLAIAAGSGATVLAIVLIAMGPDMLKAPAGTSVPLGYGAVLGLIGGLLVGASGLLGGRPAPPPRARPLPTFAPLAPLAPPPADAFAPAPAAPDLFAPAPPTPPLPAPPVFVPPPAPPPAPPPPAMPWMSGAVAPPLAVPPSVPRAPELRSPGGKLAGPAGPLAPLAQPPIPAFATGASPLRPPQTVAGAPAAPPPVPPRAITRTAPPPRPATRSAPPPLRPAPPILPASPPPRLPIPAAPAAGEDDEGATTALRGSPDPTSPSLAPAPPHDDPHDDAETHAVERLSAGQLTAPLERASAPILASSPRPAPTPPIAAPASTDTQEVVPGPATAPTDAAAGVEGVTDLVVAPFEDPPTADQVTDHAAGQTLDQPTAQPTEGSIEGSIEESIAPSAEPSLDASSARPTDHAATDHATEDHTIEHAPVVLTPESPASIESPAPAPLPPPPAVAATSTGPSPACPQCEAPMAWVEAHLRFFCKSCKMYF